MAIGPPTVPQPLPEALADINRRTPIGSVLTSAEWRDVPAAVRNLSFFSARVTSAQFLELAHRRIREAIGFERRDGRPDAETPIVDRSGVIAELQALAKDLGLDPEPGKEGTLEDVTSVRRLELIYDTNVALAYNHARWRTGQQDILMRLVPAYELIREEDRDEPREWFEIWRGEMARLAPTTRARFIPTTERPQYGGRFIAPKNDPIWQALGDSPDGLQRPYPPFRFRSGMGWRDVRRREALRLGIIDEDEEPEPAPDIPLASIAGNLQSVRGIPGPVVEQLAAEFEGVATMDGGDERIRLFDALTDAVTDLARGRSARARRAGLEKLIGRIKRRGGPKAKKSIAALKAQLKRLEAAA